MFVKNTKKNFNFRRADLEKFKSILGKSEINLDSDNIDEIISIITSTIFNAAETSIPKFSFKKFRSSLPKNIVNMIKKRKEIKKCKLKTEDLRKDCNKLTNMKTFHPNSTLPFWKKINT